MAQNFLSDIKLGDDIYIRLGDATNGDLQIYHDGTNDFIRSSGTYNVFEANNHIFRNLASNEDYAKFLGDGAVELYYNGSKKFETTSAGITVTGNSTFTGNIITSGNILLNENRIIARNTSDGSDNGYIAVVGGGAESDGRGAIIRYYGNEHASEAGRLAISSGNVSGAYIDFRVAGSERARFNNAGHFIPGADSTYDLGLNATRWRNVYADNYYGDGSNLTGVAADESRTIILTVKNKSGGSLSKGTLVHASPSATPPSGNVIEVIAAENDVEAKMPALGVLNETLADEAEGECVVLGSISGISTTDDGTSSGTLFSVGDFLYVSDTAGLFTNVKPTGTKLIQKIGIVIKAHATNGTVEIFGAGRTNDVPTPLYIDHANQRVGVGATSPVSNLTVDGNTGVYIRNSAGAKLVFDDTDVADTSIPMVHIRGVDGNMIFSAANRNATTGLTTSSAEHMRLDSNGNLGLGTDSPTNSTNYNTLDIRGTSGGQIILGRTAMDFFLYSTSTSSHLGSAAGQALVFHTNSNGGNNERMRITSGGNVGIGTTSPGQKLEVAGRIRVTTDPTIEFYESSSKRGGIQWDATNDYTNIFAVGGDIRFDIGGEKMRIDSSGNVGIGTTSPEFALHLARNAGSGGLNSGVMLEMRSSTATDPAGMRFVSQTGGSTNYMQNLYDGANLKWKHWSGSAYVDKITFSNAGDATFAGRIRTGGANDWPTGTLGNVAGRSMFENNAGESIVILWDSTTGAQGNNSQLFLGGKPVGANNYFSGGQIIGEVENGTDAKGKMTFKTSTATGGTQDVLILNSDKDATFKGDVLVPEYIIHDGEVTNYFKFSTDEILLNTGNSTLKLTSAGKTEIHGPDLGGTSGNTAFHTTIRGARHHLDFVEHRTANGTDWNNTTYKLNMRVDSTNHQSIDFVSDSGFAEHIDIRTGNQVFNTRFKHDGKVGIGTLDPGARLEVDSGGTTPMLRLRYNANYYTDYNTNGIDATGTNQTFAIRQNGSGSLSFDTSQNATFAGNVIIEGDDKDFYVKSADYTISRIINRGSGGDLDKGLFSLMDTGTEDVRIDTGGNSWIDTGYSLGLGTNSPASKFETKDGDIRVTTLNSFSKFKAGRASIPSAGGFNLGGLHFEAYSTGTTYTTGSAIESYADGAAWTSTSTPSYLSFQTVASGSTSLTERMRIESDGDVQIQTVGAQLRFQNSAGPAPYIKNSGEDSSTAPYGQNLEFYTGGSKTLTLDASQNATFADGVRIDNGDLILGEDAFSVSADYVGMKTSHQSGTNDYMIISGTSDGNTYVSARSGSSTYIRAGGNDNTHQLLITSSKAQFYGDLQVDGDVTVTGGDITLGTDSIASNINAVGDVLVFKVDSNENTGGSPNMQFKIGADTELTLNGSTATFAGNVKVGSYLHIGKGTSDYMGAIGFNRDTSDGTIFSNSYSAYQVHNFQGNLKLQVYNSAGTFQGQHSFNSDLSTTFAGSVGVSSGGINVDGDSVFDDNLRVNGWVRGASNTNTLFSNTTFGTLLQTPSNTGNGGVISFRNASGTVFQTFSQVNGDATFAGNVDLGDSTNISMSGGGAGQLQVQGNGYTGAIALNDTAMHIYHNSSLRDLVLGTNETARLTIDGGNGNATFAGDINVLGEDINFSTNGYADINNTGTGAIRIRPTGTTTALTLAGANATFEGDVTVNGGDITVNTTGKATLTLNGDSDNSGDAAVLDSEIRMLHDAGDYGILLQTQNHAGRSSFKVVEKITTTETMRFQIDEAGDATFAGHVQATQFNIADIGDYITLYGDNSANHSISSRNSLGNAADDIRINSYGAIYLNLDSNNNNTSGADFMIGRHGGAGTISDTFLTINGETGNATFAGTITSTGPTTIKSIAGSGQESVLNFSSTNVSGFGSTYAIDSKIRSITADSSNAYASELQFFTSDTSDNLTLALTLDENQDATFAGTIETPSIIIDSRLVLDNGRIYDNATNGNNKGFRIGGAGLIPINGSAVDTTNIVDLGSNSTRFKDLYLSGVANIAGNATVGGDVTVNGSHLTLANGTTAAQSTDYLYIGGDGLASADAAIYIGNEGDGSGYGYRIYYAGTGSGNNNKLILKSENLGSPVNMLSFTQDGNATFAGRVLNSYTGTSYHELQNATSNGTVLRLVSTGDNRVLYLQTDHIFSNGALYFGDNSYSTNFRGSSYSFSTGDATFEGNTVTIDPASGDAELLLQSSTQTLRLDQNSIRTTTNSDLSLFTNGNSRQLYLDQSTGGVGIGTNSAQEKLHIFNDSSAWNQFANIRLSTESDSFAAEVGFHRGTTDNTNRGLFLSGDGTNKHLHVGYTGLVGIGTDTPDRELHVEKATDNCVISAVSGTGSIAGLVLGDTDDDDVGGILYNNSANYLYLQSGGSERMRIDSSGNVGIGTDSPQAPLHVIAASTANDALIQEWSYASAFQDTYSLMLKQTVTSGVVRYNFSMVNNNTAYNDVLVLDRGKVGIGVTSPATNLDIQDSSGSTALRLRDSLGNTSLYLQAQNGINVISTVTNHPLRFDTNDTERMRIKSDGNVSMSTDGMRLRIGANSIGAGLRFGADNDNNAILYASNAFIFSTYQGNGYQWKHSGTEKMRFETDGDLHVDGDVIAYSTTVSDKALKDNVLTLENSLDKVSKLRGVEYTWNATSRKGQKDIGVIAQEVEEVIPEIVREKKMSLVDGEKYKTVDYEKLTAVLIEANKELLERVEKLEEKLRDK